MRPAPSELVTEAEAVARIPGRDAAVRAWLRELGIARMGPTGVRCYVWSEVLDRLPLADAAPAPPPSPARNRLRASSRL